MPDGGDLSLFTNRLRADSFGDDAEQYDRARPSYPAPMVDALLAGNPMDVLDVGCGTGIVSRLFVTRGCRVLGVEPDPRMAAVAADHGAAVEIGTFEGWDPAGRLFDLLVAGQSWHWVEPKVGADKAGAVLAPGGRIGLFWNQCYPADAQRQAMEEIYARLTPALASNSVLIGRRDPSMYEALAQTLVQSGGFTDVHLEEYAHPAIYTTAQWLDLVVTHSDHRTLPRPDRDVLLDSLGAAIDAIGGQVPVEYRTTLVTGTARS